MNNITSLEKSKALKAAGFRSQSFEVGQFWYIGDGLYGILSTNNIYAEAFLYNGFEKSPITVYVYDFAQFHTYAFTPSDLLKLLPQKTFVSFDGKEFKVLIDDFPMMFKGEELADVLADALLHTLVNWL